MNAVFHVKAEHQSPDSKRESLVIFSDFIDVGITVPKNVVEQDIVDFWNDNISISPLKFRQILTDNLPDDADIKLVELQTGNEPKLFLDVISKEKGKFTFFFGLNFLTKKVINGDMEVDISLRGSGIGSTLFKNCLNLAQILEFNEFAISATRLNGAFTWARLGGYLSRNKNEGLADLLLRRLCYLEGILPQPVMEKARMLCRLSNLDDIKNIADLDYNLLDVKNMWDAKGMPDAAIYSRCNKAEIYIERKKVKLAVDFCRVQDMPFTLGRYLLAGVSWEGEINLRNAKQMEKIEGYYVERIRNGSLVAAMA